MTVQKNSDGSYTFQPRKPGVKAAAFAQAFHQSSVTAPALVA